MNHTTRNLNYILLTALLIIGSSRTVAAQGPGSKTCQLNEANNGKEVSVSGTVVHSAHDLVFAVSGCSDVVVIEFSEVKGNRVLTNESGKNFARFERYSRIELKCPHGKGCADRPAYNVKAILSGRLDVGSVPDGNWKDGLGFLHDHAGKIVGQFGFGHPPIYKYRLIVTAVSKIVARRRHR